MTQVYMWCVERPTTGITPQELSALIFLFNLLYVYGILPVCTCLLTAKAMLDPGTRVTGGCEPPHGCWELNPSLLGAASALNC